METPKTVSLSGLLLLYAVLPLALGAVWLDQTVWHRTLQLALPFRPEVWVVWVYLFGMPHVIASIHTLADREYLAFYGRKLAWTAAVFVPLPFLVTSLAGPSAMFAIFTAFIVYHTIAQQYGITLAAMRQAPDVTYFIWKWSAVGVGAALYGMLYTHPFPLALQPTNEFHELIVWCAGVLLALNAMSGAILMWGARASRVGAMHVAANTAMIATEFVMFKLGYFAFVVVLARIIHEFTAWHIYATHDRNRSLAGSPNLLFRAFGFTRIPVYLLSILLAVAVGVALTYGIMQLRVAAPILVSLSLIHYYMESFLWKNGTIHRSNMQFSS